MAFLLALAFMAGLAVSIVAIILCRQFCAHASPGQLFVMAAICVAVALFGISVWPHNVVGEPDSHVWNRMCLSVFIVGVSPGVALVVLYLAPTTMIVLLLSFSGEAFTHGIGSADYLMASETVELDPVLEDSQLQPALRLYTAAGLAIQAGRLEDASFLYHIARLRVVHDLLLFPPYETGGDSPLRLIESMNQRAFALDAHLWMQPAVFRSVVLRVEKWKPEVPAGYNPGWTFRGSLSDAEELVAKREAYVKKWRTISDLLLDDDYFAAFKRVWNRMFVEKQPLTTCPEAIDSVEVLRQIEAKRGVIGMSTYFNLEN